MGRYNTLIKCAQVRRLIDENKYMKALEIIETLDLDGIHSISDLYLFARVFTKADRIGDAKTIYYLIYEHSHSKRALYQLVMMEIRTGDMKAAREAYLEYEMAVGTTLDTYELRYRLAKAEGVKRDELIALLEDLKKEEFTEEWGFQLAKLYELEGRREECVATCKDIVLWFQTGKIVEQAKELMEQCEQPDWQPPVEEIPEPLAVSEEPQISYAAEPVSVKNMDEQPTSNLAEAIQEVSRMVGANETVLEAQPEEEEAIPLEAEPIREAAPLEAEALEVSEEREMPVAEAAVEEPGISEESEEPEEAEEVAMDGEAEEADEAAMNGEAEEEEKPEPPRIELAPEDENVFFSDNDFCYFTVRDTAQKVIEADGEMHFAIAGGEERITLAVAKKMVKQINFNENYNVASIAKISADKMNRINLEEKMEKLVGSCLLILEAQNLLPNTVASLTKVMNKYQKNIILFLTGDFDELDCWFAHYPEFEKRILYKVKL